MKYSLFWAAVVCVVGLTIADSCVLVNPSRSGLLDGIKPLFGKEFVIPVNSLGSSYTVTFCKAAAPGHANASVIWKQKTGVQVLGRYNETDIVTDDKWKLITFAGGDVINIPGVCNNTKWKAVVILECVTNAESFHLVDPMNAACFALFHLSSPSVCVPPTQSRWAVFFMLILTAAVCYLFIGMAYRRFVTGAQGMEQIPNYDFWRDPVGYTRDYCNRRDMRRNEPWSHTSPMADNVDEPLLHP